MNPLLYPVILPVLAGFLCLFLPRRARGAVKGVAVAASAGCLVLTTLLLLNKPLLWETGGMLILRLDSLSGFILPACAFFTVIIIVYSLRFMDGKANLKQYYAYILWTLGAASGVILANNTLVLLVFWGILGMTLYLLIELGGPAASPAAKKTLIIVGGSDALMLMGLAIVWTSTGATGMDKISISATSGWTITAFVFLALAAFAKAGAMPMHTWIPESAETAPLPVVAYLPASLDKLLGIYLLVRVSMDMFKIAPNSGLSVFLMLAGAVTVIAAVMMALIQHDQKKLLSYHAVSQVGYMVLGIGTGIPVGIAGGLFHMLNHAIYKCCLFLTAGDVEYRTGTTDLDRLGGLARYMPVTFVCCLIAALSISGIPPFNGFFSKWMIYQGIVEAGKTGEGFASRLWVLWLIAAMFGSALTLASFMKLIHATYLGQPNSRAGTRKICEVPATMWLPPAILALLCVVFGIFAYAVPLKWFIMPAVPGESFPGFWSPGIATAMIVIGIAIGALIYLVGNVGRFRVDEPCIGGETLPAESRITGVNFYNTIMEIGLLKWTYKRAGNKVFDLYEQGKRLTFLLSNSFSRMHSGLLPVYLAWCFLGAMLLLFIIARAAR
ncbi:MAG: proton-conducting transporter membrane subunit [Candidatus Tritonobacter lacicola]|nr:proton-conducting transporter membrane subunit [Candidatus Tritonobacter lacicola]